MKTGQRGLDTPVDRVVRKQNELGWPGSRRPYFIRTCGGSEKSNGLHFLERIFRRIPAEPLRCAPLPATWHSEIAGSDWRQPRDVWLNGESAGRLRQKQRDALSKTLYTHADGLSGHQAEADRELNEVEHEKLQLSGGICGTATRAPSACY